MTVSPPIQFAHAPSGRIAYQAWGEGDVDVVSIPPAAQNIEMSWESPYVYAMLERFGSFAKMVAFDKRGTGCSDRNSLVAGLDERVDDLEAVFDAAGLERAFIFAQSEGGPMAMLFAATYPERVLGLILHGTGASMVPKGMTEAERAEYRVGCLAYSKVWGTPDSPVIGGFAPSLAHDEEFVLWHQKYERAAASSDSLVDLLEVSSFFDVREALPTLNVPTLVIHRTGDQIIPVEYGRELAELIHGAELFEVPGKDHFAYAGDMDLWLNKMERFVTGSVACRDSIRPKGKAFIKCLGGFTVEIGGNPVSSSSWGSKAARQLCKRLVVARGWPVTRDSLFDMFWPEETDRAKVGARLSVLLSNVRRVLGGGVIATRETVRLDLAAVSVDLEELLTTDDTQTVLSLYQAGFLPEDVFEEWSSEIREQARSTFVKAAREAVEAAEVSGDHAKAVELLYRLRSEDQFDERTHQQLVAGLTQLGDGSGARAAHTKWQQAMAELGVEGPSDF